VSTRVKSTTVWFCVEDLENPNDIVVIPEGDVSAPSEPGAGFLALLALAIQLIAKAS